MSPIMKGMETRTAFILKDCRGGTKQGPELDDQVN